MKRTLGYWLAAVALMVVSCEGKEPSTGASDTRTNWLMACVEDAECGSDLGCLCGVCTITCDGDTQCLALDSKAECGKQPGCSTASQVCRRTEPSASGGSSGGQESTVSTASSASAAGTGTGTGTSTSTSTTANSSGTTSTTSTTSDAGGMAGQPNVQDDPQDPVNTDAPGLGDTCYDDAVSDEVAECEEGFCDPSPTCTDSEPSHCTRSCTCHELGQQCRTVNSGEVTLDEPCCAGYTCELDGASSSGNVEVYYCQADTLAECAASCQVTVNDTTCWNDDSFNTVWLCEEPVPDEVLAGCVDMATGLPRWCCPRTVLPECLP